MDKSKVVVMLDNGHGINTPGKRSPIFDDGKTQLLEYKWNREIVDMLITQLNQHGIETYDITPELKDIPLSIRASRVNNRYSMYKAKGKTSFLISVHVNAGPNDKCDAKGWGNFKGWSVWTTKGKTNSDILAECLWEAADKIAPKYGKKTRYDLTDGDHDYEANFTIIFKPKCVAVLTENFFMNDKEEAKWLMSDEGKQACVDIHIEGIKKYIEKLK